MFAENLSFPSSSSHTIIMSAKTLDLFKGLLKFDRYSLARAITLIESNRRDHYEQSQNLLQLCLEHRQKQLQQLRNSSSRLPTGSFRIGFSGAPGVGKSTFIEGFGTYLVRELGQRVAVLAVDPSSSRSGVGYLLFNLSLVSSHS